MLFTQVLELNHEKLLYKGNLPSFLSVTRTVPFIYWVPICTRVSQAYFCNHLYPINLQSDFVVCLNKNPTPEGSKFKEYSIPLHVLVEKMRGRGEFRDFSWRGDVELADQSIHQECSAHDDDEPTSWGCMRGKKGKMRRWKYFRICAKIMTKTAINSRFPASFEIVGSLHVHSSRTETGTLTLQACFSLKPQLEIGGAEAQITETSRQRPQHNESVLKARLGRRKRGKGKSNSWESDILEGRQTVRRRGEDRTHCVQKGIKWTMQQFLPDMDESTLSFFYKRRWKFSTSCVS